MSTWIQTVAIIKKIFLCLFRNRGDFISEWAWPLICGVALVAFSK